MSGNELSRNGFLKFAVVTAAASALRGSIRFDSSNESKTSSNDLSQYDIQKMSDEYLHCWMGDCMAETESVTGEPNHYIQVVSSGFFKKSPLYAKDGKTEIGIQTSTIVVGRNLHGQPYTADVVVQMEFDSRPGVNAYLPVLNQAMFNQGISEERIPEFYNGGILPTEKLKDFMPYGSPYMFSIRSSKDTLDRFPFLKGTCFGSDEYFSKIEVFFNSKGCISLEVPLIPTDRPVQK